jgi:glycosyltransferase involved in cell wall biosynthesis
MDDLDITVFVPARNEQDNIALVVDDIIAAFATHQHLSYEIVLVDDGSTDRTLERMQAHASDSSCSITVRSNGKSLGRRLSMVAAARCSKAKQIMMVGAHYQDRQPALEAILSKVGQADVVISYLDPDLRSSLRRNLSALYAKVVGLAAGRRIRYFNGVSVLPTSDVRSAGPRNDLTFTAELLIFSLESGRSYVTVGVPCVPRETGKSHTLRWKSLSPVVKFVVGRAVKTCVSTVNGRGRL